MIPNIHIGLSDGFSGVKQRIDRGEAKLSRAAILCALDLYSRKMTLSPRKTTERDRNDSRAVMPSPSPSYKIASSSRNSSLDDESMPSIDRSACIVSAVS